MEERSDHPLHLVFTCGARSDHSEFSARRRVFVHFDPAARSCEIDHPFRHSEFDRALDIFQDKLRFGGHCVGVVFIDELFDRVEDDFVARLEGEICRRADATEVDRLCGRADYPDNSIAGNSRSGIDPQNYGGVCVHGSNCNGLKGAGSIDFLIWVYIKVAVKIVADYGSRK